MSDFKSVLELDAAQLLQLDGGMLVAIREELGLRPEEMAERLKCHSSTLNRDENERIRIPAIIVRVKELLEAEKKARNLHEALPPGLGGGQQPPAPAPTWPIVLGRGPLSPGMRLVELLPVDTSAAVTRMFAAVEASNAPNPPHEGEPTPGALATEASVHPSQPAPASLTRGTARARRFTVTALASGVAASALLVSCLVRVNSNPSAAPSVAQVQRKADSVGVRAPELPSKQVYTDNAKAGEKSASNNSIPMPKKPYPWQKFGPCNLQGGEVEKVEGCWVKIASPPPCPVISVESDGECFVPITATPKAPMSSNP